MNQSPIASRLVVAKAMVDELQHYLMQNNLYHQMLVDTPTGTQQPVMTLGALLENLDALHQEPDLQAEQRDELSGLVSQVETMRRRLPEQWQAALRRELKALLNSWKWSIEDAEANRRPPARGDIPRQSRLDIIRRELANDPASEGDWRLLSTLQARQQGLGG